MDTWLSHSRPRLELGRGIVAECGVPAQPIVEHLDVLEDILFGVVPRSILAMVDELTLERAEEAFGTGVVSAMAPARQADRNAVAGK